MSLMQLREWIVGYVTRHQGCKAVQLAADAVGEFPSISSHDILESIGHLVKNGELVEVEYNLPEMPYRVKSFLLPKGTNLYISK